MQMYAYRDVTQKSFFRFSITTLGNSKSKYSWQTLTVSIALVLNSFISNLLIAKSSERRSDIFIGHTSRPYKSSTGKHLYLTMQQDLFRRYSIYFPKDCVCCYIRCLSCSQISFSFSCSNFQLKADFTPILDYILSSAFRFVRSYYATSY